MNDVKPDNAGVFKFISCQNKLYLLCTRRKENSSYGMIFGKVEAGETPLEAVYREHQEEVGDGPEYYPLGNLTGPYIVRHHDNSSSYYYMAELEFRGSLPQENPNNPLEPKWMELSEYFDQSLWGDQDLTAFQHLVMAYSAPV